MAKATSDFDQSDSTDSKSIFTSKSFWTCAVGIVVQILTAVGYHLPNLDVAAQAEIAGSLTALFAFIFRYVASQPLHVPNPFKAKVDSNVLPTDAFTAADWARLDDLINVALKNRPLILSDDDVLRIVEGLKAKVGVVVHPSALPPIVA